MKCAKLQCESYEVVLAKAKQGDLVYCDPTYTVAHNNNGFLRYNEKVFHWSDQEKLASMCKSAGARGVKVIISNAAHPSIARLYHPYKPITVERQSCVSRTGSGRSLVEEFVFVINGNRNEYKKILLK